MTFASLYESDRKSKTEIDIEKLIEQSDGYKSFYLLKRPEVASTYLRFMAFSELDMDISTLIINWWTRLLAIHMGMEVREGGEEEEGVMIIFIAWGAQSICNVNVIQ